MAKDKPTKRPKVLENEIPELGDEVMEKITGFRGIATAEIRWLFGCNRLDITPTESDKDNKIFDITQLGVIEKNAVAKFGIEIPDFTATKSRIKAHQGELKRGKDEPGGPLDIQLSRPRLKR